ncbi:MAG: SDR family NAD(P)-dependent oxidoreductase [Planctomycetota bacterium]|nr:SDR family NAD(P)-dependent oxidoreductase [Planctomycetota bacterium]
MSDRISGRVAVVTGAGRGIGRAISLSLGQQGMRVAIAARSTAELESLAGEIESQGGQALVVPADLSVRSVPAELVARVTEAWGPVEILVNNAGIGSSQDPRPLVDFDDEFWDLSFEVNVTAPYLLTKLVLPAMLESGWGRIINVASINSKIPSLHGAAYIASKHALSGLTKATAKEVGDRGVTANAVCPGVTATLMNDKRLEYDADRTGQSFEQLEAAASPLGRRLLPEEVAALAVFLAGDEASAINGQSFNVCGGICFN